MPVYRYPDTQVTFGDIVTLLPFAVQLQKQLQSWHANLPSNLKIDLNDFSTYQLPHTLQLQ
jgi:hypothetical protein